MRYSYEIMPYRTEMMKYKDGIMEQNYQIMRYTSEIMAYIYNNDINTELVEDAVQIINERLAPYTGEQSGILLPLTQLLL